MSGSGCPVRRVRPDEPYRSRGEAQIGRMLNHHRIRFQHEQPTYVHDLAGLLRIWYPDFTLADHGGLLVEYVGRPDDSTRLAAIRYKDRVYRANGLEMMAVYPDELHGPAWPEKLLDRIAREADVSPVPAGQIEPEGVCRPSRYIQPGAQAYRCGYIR